MILTNAFTGSTLVDQDRASLISRFTASAWSRQEVPLPANATVYRTGQTATASESEKLLDPSLKRACLGLQLALSEGRRLVVLTHSSRLALSDTVATALHSLGYQSVFHGPINSAFSVLESLTDRSFDGREAIEKQIIVIEDAQTLSAALLQTLIQSSEGHRFPSAQVLLAGRPELSSKLSGRQHGASVGRIDLKPEVVIEPRSGLEFDLARAWKGGEAAKQRDDNQQYGTGAAVSPFPALAALLNQPAPARSVRRRNAAIAGFAALGLGLSGGLVGVNKSVRSNLVSWIKTILS